MLTTSKLAWQKELRGADLTHSEYRVLLTISTYTDAQGSKAHPGWDRIARDARMDKRNAKRAVANLIEKGWLRLTRKGGNNVGYRIADEYELTTPTASGKGGLATPLETEVNDPESAPDHPANDRDGRGVGSTQGVLTGHGKGGLTTPPSDHSHQILSAKRASSDAEHRPRSAADTASQPVARRARNGQEVPPPPAGRTWSDLLDDYDLMEDWLEEHIGLSPMGMSTAHGMWENERHPKAIYNAVLKVSA